MLIRPELLDLRCVPQIDGGFDSLVYKVGEKVVKVYRELDEPQLDLYRKITNKASKLLSENPFALCLRSRRGIYEDYHGVLEVVPVDGIFFQPHFSRWAAISDFIPGPNLHLLRWESMEVVEDALQKSKFQQGEAAKLLEWRADSRTWMSPYPDSSEVSFYLEDLLGVTGIGLQDQNIKLRTNPETGDIRYIITDLAALVSILRVVPIEAGFNPDRFLHTGTN